MHSEEHLLVISLVSQLELLPSHRGVKLSVVLMLGSPVVLLPEGSVAVNSKVVEIINIVKPQAIALIDYANSVRPADLCLCNISSPFMNFISCLVYFCLVY